MSGTSSPHSGLTRRSFLKATGAAAGALGLAGAAGMVTADNWLGIRLRYYRNIISISRRSSDRIF